MHSRCSLRAGWFLALLLTGSLRAADPATDMADAANRLLAALPPAQRAKAAFDWSAEERFNWHIIPRERKGLPLKEMAPAHRHLAYALLGSAMSQRGLLQATTVMSLEDILREIEQGKGPVRDPELYFVSIFGQPSATGTWGWRFEGHHLSLNFSLVKGRPAVTPSMFGTNPAEVRQGPRQGLRTLAAEQDLARQLVQSLDTRQRQAALIAETAPPEVFTLAERRARLLEPRGLPMSRMNRDQSALLRQLIEQYIRRYRPEIADAELERLDKAGAKNLHFAWAGGTEPNQGHYYRIQAPSFLIEYDNTQNNANHIHAVWRDLENDFGEDLLRQHYEQVPHRR